MAQESSPGGFEAELLRFRSSLSHAHRELLDELIRAALSERPAPVFDRETRWTHELVENVLRDIGQLLIAMDGGYRTCGGSCSAFKTDAAGDIFCTPSCSGDVAKGCECHLYSYNTPQPGQKRPDMKDWKHEWSPHDGKHFTPATGKTYECVCVKKA